MPQDLWEVVRSRRQQVRRSWPGGKGRRGFSADQNGREQHFPTHLLSGAMVCGTCGANMAEVSGKAGGYYGCIAATKGACDNKLLVRRTLVEKIILDNLKARLSSADAIHYVLQRVEEEVGKLYAYIPETLRLKETESKLRVAGANGVVSPSRIGGMRIASELVRPTVVRFLDEMLRDKKADLRIEEVPIPADVAADHRHLSDLWTSDDVSGVVLLAIRQPEDGHFHFRPPVTTPLKSGMMLVVMSDSHGRERLEQKIRQWGVETNG